MQYSPVHQNEYRITPRKYRNLQKGFFAVIGILLIIMCLCLALVVMDSTGIINKPWLKIMVPKEIQTPKEQVMVSEIEKLKQLFHENSFVEQGVKTPTIDQNDYEYFTLENGLKVLVVQDDNAKLAQAALCVHAGSWSEPDDHPGLAHFLEHMLFQGSKTYPQEGYFQKLVASAGGSTNAYTRPEETNYYFKVSNDRILESLQVFSHFFVDPLLDPSMVEREINAVNSEYEIAVSGDGWKIMHLLQLLSHKPMGRFSIGSLETLKDPMEALVKFYDEHYSSNLMALVIKSNFKGMSNWIKTESDFRLIPNKEVQRLPSRGLPLRQTADILKYRVNGDKNTMLMAYQMESPLKYKKSKPLELISQVIRSKHVDGLLEYLVRHNMALNVDAGTFLEGNGHFTFFLIEITLLDHDPIHVAEIVTNYLSQMIDAFFQETSADEVVSTPYLKQLWEQYRLLALAQFNYLDNDKQPTVQKLSHNLNNFDPDDVFSIDFLYEDFNPDSIYNYLTEMVDPSNLVIMEGSTNFKDLKTKNELYRLEYELRSLKDTELKKLQNAIQTKSVRIANEKKSSMPNMKMPAINGFIPRDFSLKSLCHGESFIQGPMVFKSREDCIQHEMDYEIHNTHPHIIKKGIQGKTLWKLQRSFKVPQIFTGLLFSTPQALQSLKDRTLLYFFNTLVSDNINQQLQDAIDAGYQFQFASTIRGVSLEIYGWSDNYALFFSNLLQQVAQLDLTQFSQVQQKVFIYYNNLYQEKLFKVALSEYLNEVMLPNYYSPTYYKEEVQTLTQSDVSDFQHKYFKNFRLTSMFIGNVLREEVDNLLGIVKEQFRKSSNHVEEVNHQFMVRDLSGRSIVVSMVHRGSDESDMNGVTLNYYQIGHRSKKNFAIMNILQPFMHNHAFQYLRTERQLGYVSVMRFQPVGCIDGAVLVVQGTAQPPYIVNGHMQDFLKSFHSVIRNITPETLEQLKAGAKSSLQEKDKSLFEESSSLWAQIKQNNIALDEKEQAINTIESITSEDILAFYEKSFVEQQSKLSLQIYGKGIKSQIKTLELLPNEEQINVASLKELKCGYTLSNI